MSTTDTPGDALGTTRTDQSGWPAPASCPVCGDHLQAVRLGCSTCGTELAGRFRTNEFAALDEAQLQFLRALVVSRGDAVAASERVGGGAGEADARMDALLHALGLIPMGDADATGEGQPPRLSEGEILARVQSGELSPEDAARLLADGGMR